jgi:hypothetical protein
VIGNIRDNDLIVLDIEVPALATEAWAHVWLSQQEQNYGGKLPGIYASSSYVETNLQYTPLNRYTLWLANWQFTPDERPPVPAPWTAYEFVQYTDRATIPGIPGTVDANIFLGGNTLMNNVPPGYTDDGITMTCTNTGHKVVLGFRDYLLQQGQNWQGGDALEDEQGVDPVEDYYSQSPSGGSRQLFNYCELAWTSTRGVYVVGIGNELFGCRADRDKAWSDLADTRSQIAILQQNGGEIAEDAQAFVAAWNKLQAKVSGAS